jgi:hypothetical protein
VPIPTTQQKSVVLFTILGPWSSQNTNVIILENIVILYNTDKKENQISLIYKEIQYGALAKSYMTNDLLVYD